MNAMLRRLVACGLLVWGGNVSALADWPQLQQNAARHGHVTQEVAPPYRARWIWFGPDHVLRNRESEMGAQWDMDLTSREGQHYPMPRELPFCLAGSMQPICSAGRLFVADCQSQVYALNADDGTTLWSANLPGGMPAPRYCVFWRTIRRSQRCSGQLS